MKKLGRLTLKELENKITVIPQVILEQIKGGDISVVFDRSDNMIYIYDWGNCIGSYPAANNVVPSAMGDWSNGTYNVTTQCSWGPRTDGSDCTYEGSFGSYGRFNVEPFYDSEGNYREWMSLHSGQSDNYTANTMGCIRTTDEAIYAIQNAIVCGGPFGQITVQD